MKKITVMSLVLALIILTTLTMRAFYNNQNKKCSGRDGCELTELWTSYNKMKQSDRPKQQLAILSEIKKEALSRRLAFDFYSAATEYVYVARQRDWRQDDTLRAALRLEIKEYDEPIVEFAWRLNQNNDDTDSLLVFIRKNEKRMKSAHNSGFYSMQGKSRYLMPMSSFFKYFYADDYEFALWSVLSKSELQSDGESIVCNVLKEYEGSSYPLGACLDYLSIWARKSGSPDLKDEWKADMDRFISRYQDKGISMYAKADLLNERFDSLSRNKGTSSEFLDLYKDCKYFEKQRDAFKGDDAKVVEPISSILTLIQRLASPDVVIVSDEDSVKVLMRNLSVADFIFDKKLSDGQDGKSNILKKTLKNTEKSFYVYDTVTVKLPALDDGSYSVCVKYGQLSEQKDFDLFRISIAGRNGDEGRCIYAADYKTGEPVSKADLALYKNGKIITTYKDFSFNGFTPLPEEVDSKIRGNTYYYLKCSYLGQDGIFRSSMLYQLPVYGKESIYDEPSLTEKLDARIFTDRGAYNPGDTIEFKTIVFNTDNVSKASSVPEGTKVRVRLLDFEQETVGEQILATNSFGSAAGKFVIPEGERNGFFSLAVFAAGKNDVSPLYSRSLRVDEFVLPAFDLIFDKDDVAHFPGDSIEVKGQVTSYSGHPVSSANSVYKVVKDGQEIASGNLQMKKDGGFSIVFKASDLEDAILQRYYRIAGYRNVDYYEISVKISDNTGETHEYNKVITVSDRIELSASLENAADGQAGSIDSGHNYDSRSIDILDNDTAKVRMSVHSDDDIPVSVKISYIVKDESGNRVISGSAGSGDITYLDFSTLPSGLYSVEAGVLMKDMSGREYKDSSFLNILLMRDSDKVLDAPVQDLFLTRSSEVPEGGNAAVLFGTADGNPVWAVADLFGPGGIRLETKLIKSDGKRGEAGSLQDISFVYKPEYPDAVCIEIFYFKDASYQIYSHNFNRVRQERELPLSFTRFADKTYPASKYTFSLRTLPDVECLAAIYDKSTESINPNIWSGFTLSDHGVYPLYVSASCGTVPHDRQYVPQMLYRRSLGQKLALDEVVVTGRSRKMGALYDAPSMAEDNSLEVLSGMVAEEMASEPYDNLHIRSDFENTLAFIPFLRSDNEGNISFDFNTSDKLSTYYVSLFAHDRNMRNAMIRREIQVTVPVKVSVVEPGYLYENDKYNLAASVSSVSDVAVSGELGLYIYPDGKYERLSASGMKPLAVIKRNITVDAGSSTGELFGVDVEALKLQAGRTGLDIDTLGFKLVFNSSADGKSFSDGIFVSVPILPSVQKMTESHSAVLLSGTDKDSLVSQLRKEFTNVSGDSAVLHQISIIDMVRAALPSKVEPSGNDVLSLTEAYYVRALAASQGADIGFKDMSNDDLYNKILACRNADGGFAWFEGMSSSPVITAVVLERFAKMAVNGLLTGGNAYTNISTAQSDSLNRACEGAVRYLDSVMFGTRELPIWCGGLSCEQYMYIRSMYSAVKFEPKGVDNKILKNFRKIADEYLVPSKERGLNAYILGKVRRIRTLENLVSSKSGLDLAKSWGLGLNARMTKSIDADMGSLLEYAVEHKNGGVFYPNAVMPFRGLLESEAYAHSMICDLLSDYVSDSSTGATETNSGHPTSSQRRISEKNIAEAQRIADGIRIWLMLQKETQNWGADPAFMDAVNSIMKGSDEVKATSVVLLSAEYVKPFSDIGASGNGFSIERHFFREKLENGNVSREEIISGELLDVGDKIIATYKIHSDENRSFVKVTAPREATLRPANQLSGSYGWWASPLRVRGWYRVVPQGYRNVKTAMTEYYFDSYPEMDTDIEEEMFVTQSGRFEAPVISIESLYAPHYRANDRFSGFVNVR